MKYRLFALLLLSPFALSPQNITLTCQPSAASTFACSGTFSGSITLAPAAASSTDPLSASLKPAPAAAPSPAVWTSGPLVKLLQEDLRPAAGDAGETLFGARNEFVSMQVHFRSPAGAAALRVSVSDLACAGGYTIKAASSDLVVYRLAYMNVTAPTARGSSFRGITGHYPDILIPGVDPYTGQTTNAWPFAVPANLTQSAWLDVHLPADVPSGWCAGSVSASDGAAVIASYPLVIGVWDWVMPSTSTLSSNTAISYGGACVQWYGGIAGCQQYPGSLGFSDFGVTLSQVSAATMMLDNRYSLSYMSNIFPGAGPFAPTDPGIASFERVYGPLLSGTAPTILKGAHLTSWSMSLLSNQVNAATFQNFQSQFQAKGWPQPIYALYDEPGVDPSAWALINKNGAMVHSFGSSIPTFVTIDLPTARQFKAEQNVDSLVVNVLQLESSGPGAAGLEDLTQYAVWIAAAPASAPKRSFLSYLSCSVTGTCANGVSGSVQAALGFPNSYPNYVVDGTAIANRVMEWLTFKHGQTGELYYYVDICDEVSAGGGNCGLNATPGATSPNDPWLANEYAGGWGDGTLIYPASVAKVGTKTPIWVPSLRLKMIRDGMQDYEYLAAVAAAGNGALTQKAISQVLQNSYTFTSDAAVFLNARLSLGQALHALKHP